MPEPIGAAPPAEAKERSYAPLDEQDTTACLEETVAGQRGAAHALRPPIDPLAVDRHVMRIQESRTVLERAALADQATQPGVRGLYASGAPTEVKLRQLCC